MVDIEENLGLIRSRMDAACERSGRDPADVVLVAVSKGQPPEAIQAAVDAGLILFGESRVQEAKAKIGRCPGHLRWHLVGHLQSNKCRDAVQFFSMIHSVDSVRIAAEIDKWAERQGKSMPILMEVNAAGEASKYGFAPQEVPAALDEINALRNVEVHGLMTIVPYAANPERGRPYFARLRALKIQCEDHLGVPISELSMGMSHDFEIAIEEGATMVRIGTDLFGERPPLASRRQP